MAEIPWLSHGFSNLLNFGELQMSDLLVLTGSYFAHNELCEFSLRLTEPVYLDTHLLFQSKLISPELFSVEPLVSGQSLPELIKTALELVTIKLEYRFSKSYLQDIKAEDEGSGAEANNTG